MSPSCPYPSVFKAIFCTAGGMGHGTERSMGMLTWAVWSNCTIRRADLGSAPGETSLHLISAARAERGGSERLGSLPIPALSGHFPTTPHLNGLRQHGQEVDNEAILHRASMPLCLKLLKGKIALELLAQGSSSSRFVHVLAGVE